MTPAARHRFEVRVVDETARALRYVDDYYLFHDACIAADIGREDSGDHFVVWCSRLKKTLYDSRTFAAQS